MIASPKEIARHLMADLRGIKNEGFKGRRHSYSARGFASKFSIGKRPPSSSHTSSSTHSTPVNGKKDLTIEPSAGSLNSLAKGAGSRKRISFKGFFRSKSANKQSLKPAASLGHVGSTSSITSSDQMAITDPFRGQDGEFVRVITTILNPQLHYKTLRITQYSTVYEVIVKLVGKYGQSIEDQNPDIFYMTEVRESDQGSYSRVLENSDRVYEIQSRWENGKACSFTLCRKEFIAAGDDPFLANPFNAMVLSPSQDSFYNDFTGLIDVDIPNTPTSPNVMAQKFSFFDPPPSSINMLSSSVPVPTSFVLPVSPSDTSDSTEVDVTANESTNTSSSLSDKESPWKHKPSEVNRLMQLSLSEGMIGIMTKVMDETKERKVPQAKSKSGLKRRATVSLTTYDKPILSSPAGRKGGESVILRPLIFSPVESAQKRYPELVVTQKAPVVDLIDSCSGEGSCKGLGKVKKLQLTLDDSSDYPVSKIKPTSPTISNKTTEKKTNLKYTDTSNSCSSSVNYFKTSHYIPMVKFVTSLIVYPRYCSSASIYPSFSKSEQYSTEMDMSTAVTSMLDTRFRNHQFRTGRERCLDSTLKNGTDTSSYTKERGTNRNTSKSTLRRPHTFHVKREHFMLHSLNQEEDKPHLKDHIVERAALAIQQRNHQKNSLGLSENDTFPRHIRQGSSTSRRGSSSSITSEVESDLDTLLTLRSRRLSSCSGSSEQSLTANEQQRIHLRMNSDGIISPNCKSVSPHHDRSLNSSNSTDRGNPTLHPLFVPPNSKSCQYSSHPNHFPNTHSTSNLHQQAASSNSSVPNSPLYKTTCNGFQTTNRFSLGTDTWRHRSVEELNTLERTAAVVKYDKPRSESDSDSEKEVLYTFQSNQRPITVLVRCKSSVALHHHPNSGGADPDKDDKNLRITKSSLNLATSSSDNTSEHMTVTERGASLRKNKEIWDFSQRRCHGKVKSWFSDL